MSVAILGLAAYPADMVWHNVELLVRSARRNSPRTSIVLVTAPLASEDRRWVNRFAVETLERVEPPPTDGAAPEVRQARQRWILELFGRRHGLYEEAIAARPESHFLLADTRDVIVTGPLEDGDADTGLVLSQEDAATTIGDEPYNHRWIEEGYGGARLAAIGGRPILCAGTVFGPRAHILDYLRSMAAEVARLGVEMTRRIGDQPLHNHLAYAGKLPDYTISPAEDGWIRAIGVQRFADVQLDWDPAHRSGIPRAACAVVHQYDRHLASRRMRHAVARVAGLPLAHRWRLEAYRDNGRDFGSRVLRRIARSTDSIVRAVTDRQPK